MSDRFENPRGISVEKKLKKLGVTSPDLSELKKVELRPGLIVYAKRGTRKSEVFEKYKGYL